MPYTGLQQAPQAPISRKKHGGAPSLAPVVPGAAGFGCRTHSDCSACSRISRKGSTGDAMQGYVVVSFCSVPERLSSAPDPPRRWSMMLKVDIFPFELKPLLRILERHHQRFNASQIFVPT